MRRAGLLAGSVLALQMFHCETPASSARTGSGQKEEPRRESPLSSVTQPVVAVDPTTHPAASASLLDRGAKLYLRQCAPCHGPSGGGDGPAAYLLYPKPRNFQKGQFRFTSTWEGTPTDDDLFRTVSRGLPGSAMPAWGYLPEADRWALVHYVKSLVPDLPVVASPKPPNLKTSEPGQGVVEIPPEPPDTEASRTQGARLFGGVCQPCHGARGEGDGPNVNQLKDDDGVPLRPRNLRTGVFKGDPRPEHLFRRIVHGILGTPMPAAVNLASEDGWHVVHFIRSLSSDVLRDRAEMKRFRIPAVRVERIPDNPDSGAWRSAPAIDLHLMPLWWRYNRPEFVTVRAVHDDKELAVLLMWADDTHDQTAIRPQDFRDACAVAWAPAGEDPPFFGMGEKGRFVNIWMWKSERQADVASGFHDLETQYPNIGIDSYPNLMKAPYEQPMRHALTLDSDPTYITGWGAGNIVSDPLRRSAAEDLSAQGFGTLKAHSMKSQDVLANGVWSNGSYRVVLRRTLAAPNPSDIDLSKGNNFPIAFAIWNGSEGDRDGKKSVSIWQELVFTR